MKEKVTEFDLTAAFSQLNDIEVPAVRGMIPNKPELKEGFKARKLKTDVLFEDYYDVNDQQDMNQAADDRQEDVAQAKLSRIEKIVDLDAETAADVEGSYVGRNVVRCPQCMTLFYRKPEDLVADENDPKTVNVGEECPNCGNTTGYELLGKIDEVTPEEMGNFNVPAEGEQAPAEEAPAEEAPATDEKAEEPAAEEAAPAEGSADQTDDLDLDLDLGGEEEKKEESLHRSEANEPVEKKHLSDNDSKNLTLNEDVDTMEEPVEDTIIVDLSDGGNVNKIKVSAKDEELAHEVDDEATRLYDEAQDKLDAIDSEEAAEEAGLGWEYQASGADFFFKAANEMGLKFDFADEDELDVKPVEIEADQFAESCNINEGTEVTVDKDGKQAYAQTNNNKDDLVSKQEVENQIKILQSRMGSMTSNGAIDPSTFRGADIIKYGNYVNKLNYWKDVLANHEYREAVCESVDENKELNKKLDEHDAYIKYLQAQVKVKKEAVKAEKNEFIKNSLQKELDALNADLEAAIPEEVKTAAEPAPEETPMPEDVPAPEEQPAPTEANDAAVEASAEAPAEEPANESLNNAEANKDVNKKECSDNDSENLTLNEAVEDEDTPAEGEDDEVEHSEKVSQGEAQHRFLNGVHYGIGPNGSKRVGNNMTFGEKSAVKDGVYYLSHNNIAYAESRALADAIKAAWDNSPKGMKRGAAIIEPDGANFWVKVPGREPDWEKGLVDPYADKENESINNPEADKEHRTENKSENATINECDAAPVEEAVEPAAEDKSDEIVADKLETEEPVHESADSDLAAALDTKEFNTPVSEEEVEKDLAKANELRKTECMDAAKLEELEEIDDKSVEECITESLTNVYENVKSFNMTNCLLNQNTLVVEGKINFKSGNSKATKYCFTEAVNKDGKLILTGVNEGLSADGKFTMTCRTDNKSLITEGLEYNYKVGDNSVNGKVSK